MTGCCRAGPCEQVFRPRIARRALARHRRKGLDDLELEMVGAAVDAGLDGARVLELGGGLGVIGSELLAAGAAENEIAELVAAWEPYALELALVVLHRVVCCSSDGVELTAEAARHTRRVLVLSFPRDTVWTRAWVGVLNAAMWGLRRTYRAFVHPPAALAAAAESNGLRRSAGGRGLVWEHAAFVRP